MREGTTVSPLAAFRSELGVVPVVSAIDANFVPVYSVFLASLLAHSKPDRFYDLILLTENVSADAMHAFQTQVWSYDHVSLRSVDMTNYPVPFLDKVGFKKPAFFRLIMPDLLPEYTRAVYLDADTVLLDDVAKLYDALKYGFAAAIPDITMQAYYNNPKVTEDYLGSYGNIGTYWDKHLNLSDKARAAYFNSGVLVFDLEKMRQSNIVDKTMALLRTKPFIFPDQDILNIVFDGDVQKISLQWNFFQALNPKLEYPDDVLADRALSAKKVCLIHYAWKKPWIEVDSVPYEEYFWFYARQSIYYEQLLTRRQNAAQARRFFVKMRHRLATSQLMKLVKGRFPTTYDAIRTSWRGARRG
ncbi:glycosyltransferase family 8 protein [Desulfomicrobium salsuginis]